MWRTIESMGGNEALLQKVFDHLDGHLAAGWPAWLLARGENLGQRSRDAFGYSFETDAELIHGDHHYVVELKRALKYEPLALAEVLHHAAWIRRYEGTSNHVVPVIVSSNNLWTRLAVAELSSTVRYYEADLYEIDGRTLMWLDEPLAPWKPDAAPPPPARDARLCWHYIPRTNTWVGTKRPHAERPLILEEPHVMIAELADQHGYIAWEGTVSPNRTPKPREIDNGRFYFCTEPGGSGGPTWLAAI
ncbi:MAG TPA: hypothetical protein VH143_16410 [Kofleriaceae bacterium]|jgi:hypothetical protein|nr:hypothetical protein [Kofleriaceae bacterium]